MEENYIIKKEDFKKLAQWATDIDSITTVVEYFISTSPYLNLTIHYYC